MTATTLNASGQGRILLVDDDETVRSSYARLLGKMGYIVESVATGSAALARIGIESFDVVITDVNMDHMTGTQFLRAIREQHLDLPVILMTGVPGMETSTEAVEYAAFRYLVKPVRLSTLKKVPSAMQFTPMRSAMVCACRFPCRRSVNVWFWRPSRTRIGTSPSFGPPSMRVG